MDCLAWLLTHSFGISLVYPGSMGLMGMLVEKPLLEGRTKLSQEGGQRYKIVARDGNEIDTMFVQQRTRLAFVTGCFFFLTGPPLKMSLDWLPP